MTNKLLFILIALVLSVTAWFSYLHFNSTRKIGYVTTMKVFDEFKLKKELENEYKKVQMAKQSYLDSLKLNIQRLAVSGKRAPETEEQINTYKKAYLIRENQFNEENQVLFDQYNSEIWKQLNQYLEDYGHENGYDYLLGASGQGSIMYADEKDDLTKEIINYVNTKYSGKKNS